MVLIRWASKAFWATWRIAVPFMFFEGVNRPLTFLALFLVTEWMTGYYLAFNFQVHSEGIAVVCRFCVRAGVLCVVAQARGLYVCWGTKVASNAVPFLSRYSYGNGSSFRLIFHVAQVSHVSTECDYPLGAEAKDMIEDSWAVSQVRTW